MSESDGTLNTRTVFEDDVELCEQLRQAQTNGLDDRCIGCR